MKTAEEWYSEFPGTLFGAKDQKLVEKIQADAFKAGQEATMKWVGEECRRQTERLIGFQQNPEPLF